MTLTIPENTTTLETFREPALPGRGSHGSLKGCQADKDQTGTRRTQTVSAPARIPDNVALPELPLGAEAAHSLPVQEGSLLRKRPHHTVAGSDLGQRERTVDLHGSSTGAIHAETCRGGRKDPRDTPSGFHSPFSSCCWLIFLFWYSVIIAFPFIVSVFSF